MLTIRRGDRAFVVTPGEWRSTPEQDVEVGNHLLPPSGAVAAFIDNFDLRFAFEPVPGRVMQGVTQLPKRTARRVLKEATEAGLLASETPKGPVSLRFPSDTLDILFPPFTAESRHLTAGLEPRSPVLRRRPSPLSWRFTDR